MILQLARARRKLVLIDISTQRDFLLASGNACIRNHGRVLMHIRRVMAWARLNRILVISIADVRHSSGNGNAECCVDGTDGQRKIRYTLLTSRFTFPADCSTDLPIDLLQHYRQIILHKRCVDPFDEPRIEGLLTGMRANEFILIGTTAEGSVLITALGLLQRGKNVKVVTDAVGSHDRKEAEMAFRKMGTKGAKLVETRSIAGKSHLRRVGICGCKDCSGARVSADVQHSKEFVAV